MAVEIMARVWPREDLESNEKYVLLALANMSGLDGVSWPAVETIQRRCSFKTPRTVQTHLKSLAAKGLLRILPRKDRSSLYIINLKLLPFVETEGRPKEEHPLKGQGVVDTESDLFEGTPAAPPQIFPSPPQIFPSTPANFSMTPALNAPRNVKETSLETSYSTGEAESDEESERQKALQEALFETQVSDHFEAGWNAMAERFPKIASMRMTERRKPKLLARIRERVPIDDLDAARSVVDSLLERIEGSPFLCGEVKEWAVSVDWVLGVENFTKTMERRNERESSGPTGGGRSNLTAGHRALDLLDARRRKSGGGGSAVAG